MGTSEDLSQLSIEELQQTLDSAQSALDDVLEERMFVLGQTGAHLGASKVASLRAQWDRDEANLRQRIASIQDALSVKAGSVPRG